MKRLTLTAEFSAIVLAWTIAVPAQAYEAGPVTGGGTIDGKVVFNDAVPTRKIIPNKDVEVCGGIREEPLIAGWARQGRPERGRVPGRGGQGKSMAGSWQDARTRQSQMPFRA